MVTILKRDGRSQNYDVLKMLSSIINAANDAKIELENEDLNRITDTLDSLIKDKDVIDVEKLQDMIEKALYISGYRRVRMEYKEYRNRRNNIRDKKSKLMGVISEIGVCTDRDNANVGNNFSAKLLRIASESNKWAQLANMDKDIAKLHEELDFYIHDLDSYNLTINCLHIPTGKVLGRGFNTGYGTINKPNSIETAAELSCILMQSTQNDMFGGQSHPNFDNDLAEYVGITRRKFAKEIEEFMFEIAQRPIEIDEHIEEMLEKKVLNSVRQAMQAVVYNLNTMHCRAGSQVPFSSINLGIPKSEDAALICKIFLEEYEKGLGKGEQPIFPNIIFRVKSGVNRNPGDKYYYLYELACRVASKRMNPTFMNIDADFNKEFYNKGIIPSTMGCRTYLMTNVNGEAGVEGRGNNAPTTINLPRLGIKAMLHSDIQEERVEKFFELLDDMILKARKSLLHRYEVMKKLKVKDLPFVIGQELMVGSEGLKPDDSIDPVLRNGTWGIGFTGLAETLIAICGKHHGEDEYARDLGEKIISRIRQRCDELKESDKMNWSCYATPAEGLSGKFVPRDREKYGVIKGVTDKDFYTNGFHVPVYEQISIKDKIAIEAPYHKMCNGGHISYIEMDSTPSKEDIMSIINYAYENTNISYIGINFHIRYCKDCGTYLYNGEQKCDCGSSNIQGVSRVTGYLSLDERFGPGKTAERLMRTNHNGDHTNNYYL